MNVFMGLWKIYGMSYALKKAFIVSLFTILLLVSHPCTSEGTLSDLPVASSFNHTPELVPHDRAVLPAPQSIYTIKFVSPGLMSTILKNHAPTDVILKAGPGIVLGVATPGILYVRGDLQSEEFLIRNRQEADLKTRIGEHLLDISYGRDNDKLLTLQKDREYMIWFDAAYTADDISHALSFARMFNNLSATTQFEDEWVMKGVLKNNYETVPYYYYNVRILPDEFLKNYEEDSFQPDREEKLYDDQGRLIGFLSDGAVLLWDGLPGEERQYQITRALLWYIGLHGETDTDPDSFFATGGSRQSVLSELDQEAVRLLYGGRLKMGMTAQEVKDALALS